MLDQTFSAANFYEIFQIENKKGNFENNMLSKEYLDIHKKVKRLLILKPLLDLMYFNSELKKLNAQKEDALNFHLQEISDKTNLKSFAFCLDLYQKDSKTIYTIKKDAASFFAMKQLQHNIAKTFKVKQSDRFEIVKQLRIILQEDFPKFIFKIDIASFYETISQDLLLKKIEENSLLTFQSKKLIKALIFSYENTKPSEEIKGLGIPRGIGASAYLSELYMRDIDNHLKDIKDLVYYARYVDDIVLVFVPHSKEKYADYFSQISEIIKDNQLTIKDGSDGKENKLLKINIINDYNKKESFNFLGYKFCIQNSKLRGIYLSDNKLEKYENRIRLTIEEYNKCSKFNEKKAKESMINRFKFLTGNFHLLNNKKRVRAGIYYSNILISLNKSKIGEFKHLDKLLKKHLSSLNPNENLNVKIDTLKKVIMKRFSFNEGFYNRGTRFHTFNKTQLSKIKSIWNN